MRSSAFQHRDVVGLTERQPLKGGGEFRAGSAKWKAARLGDYRTKHVSGERSQDPWSGEGPSRAERGGLILLQEPNFDLPVRQAFRPARVAGCG
jgi:hypothetical protein